MYSVNNTDRKSKRSIWGLLLFGLIALLTFAWVAETSAFGTTVTNGTIAFRAPDAKAGENMAEILNKAEKKGEKQDKKDERKNKK